MTPVECSKLFLSVDLVGSTSYKQQQGARGKPEETDFGEITITIEREVLEGIKKARKLVDVPARATGRRAADPPWQQSFLEFYLEFPGVLAERTKAWLAAHPNETEPVFTLWKPIGDELVFTVDIQKERDVYAAVRIWLAAMDAWDTRIKKLGMGTKGGAFIATFPHPDRAVAIPRKLEDLGSAQDPLTANDDACADKPNHERYLYDYFGPSIDTGFRLFSQATPRRFSLSVEVSLCMFVAAPDDVEDIEYNGGRELKGVWNGRDYPFFTVDRLHADPVNQAVKALRDDKTYKDSATAIKLCQACIADPKWPSGLYLEGSNNPVYQQRPKDNLAKFKNPDALVGLEKKPTKASERPGTKDLPDDPPLGEETSDGE